MSMIKCPECQSEISDKAESCPKCGCPITEEYRSNATKVTIEEIKRANDRQKISDGKNYAKGEYMFELPYKIGCLAIIIIALIVMIAVFYGKYL